MEVLLSEHHYRSTTVLDVAMHISAKLESPLLYVFSFSLALSQTRRMLSFILSRSDCHPAVITLVHLMNIGHALLKYWSAVK